MASRRKGLNRQLPHHLSDLLHKLSETGTLFIELYDHKKERMQTIASELLGTSIVINKMQKSTNSTRMMGAFVGGLGVVGVAAALFAGGSSASEGAGRMALLGGTAALFGSAAVISANVTKAETEKISIETVEELGKEFMAIIELLKDVLIKIKKASEELEENSSSLMTTTREQTQISLSKTKQLQQVLKQTTELSERSKKVMDATLTMLMRVRELLNFIVSITRITPSSEEDAKLRTCITESALQCERTVLEYAKMRNTLKDFEEMIIE